MKGQNMCTFCCKEIHESHPRIHFKDRTICYDCYLDLISAIYEMAGCGDGGLIHLIFSDKLKSRHNRTRKHSVSRYRENFKKLLHKYNFKCVNCSTKENLTIDHIIPVSKGGSDDESNLQILCKSCNSSKGTKDWKSFMGSCNE